MIYNSDLNKGTSSTTRMCTAVLRVSVSYYVYGFTLEEWKAFNRIDYCRLFSILMERKVSRLVCLFLLNTSVNQTLCVKCNEMLSSTFVVSNGAKQSGVICLSYCIAISYVDGPLSELMDTGVGGICTRALGFAIDLKGLEPRVLTLNKMISICEDYTSRYVEKKSKLIPFQCNRKSIIIANLQINGKIIETGGNCTPGKCLK